MWVWWGGGKKGLVVYGVAVWCVVMNGVVSGSGVECIYFFCGVVVVVLGCGCLGLCTRCWVDGVGGVGAVQWVTASWCVAVFMSFVMKKISAALQSCLYILTV